MAPFAVMTLQRWPSHRKHVSILGLAMIITALVAASFTTRVAHLILTQGLLYGMGGALLYNPFLFYLNEWFSERKGLAYGVFWAGTGIFGSTVPWLMEWSLMKYGSKTTLRAWAAFTVRPVFLLWSLNLG
jgi:MFS family permease